MNAIRFEDEQSPGRLDHLQKLTDRNFAALCPTETHSSPLKNLDPGVKIVSAQETGNILKIDFVLSK